MDPFSIAVGTFTVAEVCARLIKYLRTTRAAAADIQKELEVSLREVQALSAVNDSIQGAYEAFEAESKARPNTALPKGQQLQSLWQQASATLTFSKSLIEKLEELVQSICGGAGPETGGKLDAFRKAERRRSKREALRESREHIVMCHNRLQIVLFGIEICNQQMSQEKLDQVTQKLTSLEEHCQSTSSRLENKYRDDIDEEGLSLLQQLRTSISSVTAAIKLASLNKHFDIPQSVSSIYTGRETYLRNLKQIFLTSSPSPYQRRFVIHGVAGSGKTQFCSKFAQDNRDLFWGVFWIDASSHHRIKQTFSQIAKVGKVEPNEGSALHWLSNLDEKWLLIIDNADDPAMKLERYFPRGDRGHVLITTRCPDHRSYGNTDPGFFEFHSLEDKDANTLLLRAAGLQPEPEDVDTSTWAARITTKLGYLALALTQAGAAIRSGLCTLKNYLGFYDESWIRIRNVGSFSVDSSDGTSEYMSVYATYEVSFQAIEKKDTQKSRDAVQLLKMFAFLHHTDIRVSILARAIDNKEIEEHIATAATVDVFPSPRRWTDTFTDLRTWAIKFIMEDRNPPPLPSVIRDSRARGRLENIRLRLALKELVQTSLITYDRIKDSYSMHPLVHKWARERPEMSTAEQMLWAQVAATTLSHSILIPPLGGSEEDERFNQYLLPHVDHVGECIDTLQSRMSRARNSSWLAWMVPQPGFGRAIAIRSVKFSLIYSHGGRFKDAEKLQRLVKDYTYRALGPSYSNTRRITLALANTLWHMGRSDEAADLQESVLEACTEFLGPRHAETLSAMNTLGQTRWQQGRYSDALKLQEDAVAGLIKVKGYEDEATLGAMDDLGRTLIKFYTDYDRAKILHTRAIDGMKKTLGSNHSRTLIAIENLAGLEVQRNGDVHSACNMMEEVLSIRRQSLGKEHAFTLLAIANLARARTANGEHEAAEELLREGLPVAERTLDKNHIGLLMGRTILAMVMLRQGRLLEAEKELLDISDLQRYMSDYRGDAHPDRIGTMIQLAECYKLRGKYDESIRYCDEVIDGLTKISTKEHPLAVQTRSKREEVIRLRDSEAPSRA